MPAVNLSAVSGEDVLGSYLAVASLHLLWHFWNLFVHTSTSSQASKRTLLPPFAFPNRFYGSPSECIWPQTKTLPAPGFQLILSAIPHAAVVAFNAIAWLDLMILFSKYLSYTHPHI